MSRLSDVATGVIRDSKADTVANLRALVPTLTNLTKAGDDLAYATKALLTYPFSDGFVANTYAKASGKCDNGPPTVKEGACFGDFANLSLGLDIGANQLQTILDGYAAQAGVNAPDIGKVLEDPVGGLVDLVTGLVPSGGSGLPGVTPGQTSGATSHADGDDSEQRWHLLAARHVPHGGGQHSGRRSRTTSRGTGGGAMISRLTKIQLVIFAIVTVLGGAFVGGRYAQIDRLVVDRSFPVSAQFKDSGGIFAGAQVTYRGIPVGKVGKLRFKDQGVQATLDIENDAPKIPADVLAPSSPTSRRSVSSSSTCSRGPTPRPTCARARRSRWPTLASRSTPRHSWSTSTTWSRRSTPTASARSSTSWVRLSRARARTCPRSSTPRRSSSRPPTTTST